ncbi:unnamed protein product [Malus baccata var. baccata]
MAGSGGKRLGSSCFLLIVIAGLERFAYKGVASNLVTYLTDVVKMSNSAAAKTVNSWCGFTSMLPLLVAPLVDSYWDRYPTILVSSFLYVAGLVALTSTAFTRATPAANKTSSNSSFLFGSLYLISLGQGGYNPSLQAFGADQLDSEEELPSSKDDQKSSKKRMFFQHFRLDYRFRHPHDIDGYIGCGVYEAMDYKPIFNIVQVIKATALKLMKCRIILPNETNVTELKPLCRQNNSSTASLVGNPKSGFYLLPIWIMLLMFAVIFQQPPTFFTKQGMTMKRNIGSNFKIPPATLQSAITLSIILLMPLYDKIMIPITRLVTSNEKGISVMQRMGIGMFVSVIAMISREMEMLGSQPETVPFSIFWLLPQYILLGISDIFTVVGIQEFFYSEVPRRMRTMAFALYTSVFGVGSYCWKLTSSWSRGVEGSNTLLIATVEAVTSSGGRQSWFSDDMNEARLDKYYWFSASLSALSFVFYVILSRCYTSMKDLDLENEVCK